jgi:hypothetical protein
MNSKTPLWVLRLLAWLRVGNARRRLGQRTRRKAAQEPGAAP